jgi:hypothetical protein
MRENMHARLLRARLSVVSLCLALIAGVALPTATLFTALQSSAPAAAANPPQDRALKLDVEPARPSTAQNWPDKVGQPIEKRADGTGHFKWLIQQDNTGDANQPSGPVASNDGTLSCTGGICTLHSPSAPFQLSNATPVADPASCSASQTFPNAGGTHDPNSPDLGVIVTWTPQGSNSPVQAYITTVCDAQDVILGSTFPSKAVLSAIVNQAPTPGTLLFSVLRADPCHPLTPNTPEGDTSFPQNCQWPSIIAAQHPPVVTQGDDSDWASGKPLSGVPTTGTYKGQHCVINDPSSCGGTYTLPDGKYFVSVTSDGYEIGGANFTIPSTSDTVNVRLNPGPLTLGTMKILVFDDMASTAGAYEATTDSGMSGFSAFITDFTGAPVNQDYFGNPLCTQYLTDDKGNVVLKADGTPKQITKLGGQCVSAPAPLGTLTADAGLVGTQLAIKLLPGVTDAHLPVPGLGEWTPFNIQIGAEIMTVTQVCLSGGAAVSSPGCASFPAAGNVTFTVTRSINGKANDLKANITTVPDPSDQPQTDGVITIPNLAPGRYGANVVPPDQGWIETTTLEGSHDFDVWVMGNDSGLDTELTSAGEPVPFVDFGFARAAVVNINGLKSLCTFDPQTGRNCPSTGTSEVVPSPAQGKTLLQTLQDPQAWAGINDPELPVIETDPGATPTTGAFVTAGCQVAPPTDADGNLPTGDIRAELTVAMQPCAGANLRPRIEPGMPGQNPTQDGSLEADSWTYPWYDDPVYHLGGDPNTGAPPAGELKGRIAGVEPYVPGVGGLNGVGGANGQAGEQVSNIPISDGWVAIADLNNGDLTSMVLPANDDGTFDVKHIPDGTYNVSWWDWDQDYAFDQYQIVIAGGQMVDVGTLPLSGWFTKINGHVFIDTNANGKQDPGEKGVPDFLMQLLNRTNNAWEGGQNVATTNDSGYYEFKEAYPLGQDMILQFYNPRYRTTGVTCQTDNDPQAHTTLTPAVDLTTLNIIGLNGYCDVGIQPYSTDPTAGDNGGIVATAQYHSFRPGLSEEQEITEPFDSGQPGVRFELWKPRPLKADATADQVKANQGNKYLTCTQANIDAGNLTGGATDIGCGVWSYNSTSATPDSYRLDGGLVRDPVPMMRTDKGVTGQSGGDPVGTVHDANVLSTDSGLSVYGPGVPDGAVVGDVDQGASFVLVDGNGVPVDTSGGIGPNIIIANPGLVDVYYSEHFQRGGANAYSQPGCVPRGADGQVLDWQVQDAVQVGGDCIESALQGTSFSFGSDANPVDPKLYDKGVPATNPLSLDPGLAKGNYTNGGDPYPGLNDYCNTLNGDPGAGGLAPSGVNGGECGLHGVQVVDGNYGLTPPSPGDYIVHPIVPNDMFGKPLYKFATEADVNIYDGPGWVPQNATGDVDWGSLRPGEPAQKGQGSGFSISPGTASPAPDAQCVGAQILINNTDPQGANYVDNPSFVAAYHGKPPFEQQMRAKCDAKLIHVQNGQSVAPNFLMYTDVPIASVFGGYATDDISVSTNKLSTGLGEVQPIPNLPIGIYDWTGRQVSETNTDYNGQWLVMLPSTNTMNCNTVAGPCPSVYRFVGNDPGQPASPNLNWNPAYQTIAAQFQAWPGEFMPSDVAPTRTVVAFEGGGSQYSAAAICAPRASTPQLFAVSHPFFKPLRNDTYNLVIQGVGFGSKPASLQGQPTVGVTLRPLDNSLLDGGGVHQIPLADITTWTDTEIDVQLANGGGTLTGLNGIPAAPYELVITNTALLSTSSAVTFHVMGANYNPHLLEVGDFNSGTLRPDGTPAGSAIKDDGWNNPSAGANAIPSAGPVQDLVDSTTGGFNPYNDNFLPKGDPTAQDTGGGSQSFGNPGDEFVKGAIQRSLEAAYHYWQANVGVLDSSLSNAANATTLTLDASPGVSAQDFPIGTRLSLTGGGAETVMVTNPLPTNSPSGKVTIHVTRGAPRRGHSAGSAVTKSVAANTGAGRTNPDQNVIVVYPNFVQDPTTHKWGGEAWDPLSAYFENIVIHSPVMLQGVGPGGYYKNGNGDTVTVPGSTIDGRFFNANTTDPAATANDAVPGSEPWAWDLEWLVGDGNQNADGIWTTQPYYNLDSEGEGAVVMVLGDPSGSGHGGWYTRDAITGANGNFYRPSIDGLGLTGGDQKGFADNISETGGGTTVQRAPDEDFSIEVQGGAIYMPAGDTNFQISNNLVQWNSGAYGTIRIGSPQTNPAEADPNAHNSNLHIHHNRIIANGGTNLAGAIGIFRGADGYRINDNVICGNLSAEYGAGISHFGYSPNGQIDHNKIMLNQAIDEGGGIMIAGEPRLDFNTSTPNPNLLAVGAGRVSVHDNVISTNLAYDDGGGLRFLQANAFPYDVTNNIITDNVSAHEGGGVSIDDAPNVRLVNNTIANNITTATATTSTGDQAPAGISTAGNSGQLASYLNTGNIPVDNGNLYPVGFLGDTSPPTTTTNRACTSAQVAGSAAACNTMKGAPFSNPVIKNDILWDNLAGTWDSLHSTVTGVALQQNLQFSAPTGDGKATLLSACPSNNTTNMAPCVPASFDKTITPWDAGVADSTDTGPIKLTATNSVLTSTQDLTFDGTDRIGMQEMLPWQDLPGHVSVNDPKFVDPFMVAVQSDPYRLNARFRPSTLITLNLPANLTGNYHVQPGSSAVDGGTTTYTPPGGALNSAAVPATDIDNQARPVPGPQLANSCLPAAGAASSKADIGADECWTAPPTVASFTRATAVGGQRGAVFTAAGTGSPSATVAHSGTGNRAHYIAPPSPPQPGTYGYPVPGPDAGGLGIVPAASPTGGLVNVASVGPPNPAGNSSVVAYPGLKVSADGTPVVTPKATGLQPAPVPGGATGGGKFMHHKYGRGHGSGTAGRVAAWLVAVAGIGVAFIAARRQRGGRPRRSLYRRARHGRAAAQSPPPPDDDPVDARPLALAGKGDWS